MHKKGGAPATDAPPNRAKLKARYAQLALHVSPGLANGTIDRVAI